MYKFKFIEYFLGLLLIVIGIRGLFVDHAHFDITKSKILQSIYKYCNVINEFEGGKFIIKKIKITNQYYISRHC